MLILTIDLFLYIEQISGQDRSSSGTPLTVKQNSAPYLKLASVRGQEIDVSQKPSQSMIYYRVSSSTYPISPHSPTV